MARKRQLGPQVKTASAARPSNSAEYRGRASADLAALGVRFADTCRPPRAYGALRIHGYALRAVRVSALSTSLQWVITGPARSLRPPHGRHTRPGSPCSRIAP